MSAPSEELEETERPFKWRAPTEFEWLLRSAPYAIIRLPHWKKWIVKPPHNYWIKYKQFGNPIKLLNWKLVPKHIEQMDYNVEQRFKHLRYLEHQSKYKETYFHKTSAPGALCNIGKTVEGLKARYQPERQISVDRSSFQYIDTPHYPEPKDIGIGTKSLRLSTFEGGNIVATLDEINLLRPLHRTIHEDLNLDSMKDGTLCNMTLCLINYELKEVQVLIDWIRLHQDKLIEWRNNFDELDVEIILGSTPPFDDISSVDKKFLDNLYPPLYKRLLKRHKLIYYQTMLDLARLAIDMEFNPLIILMKKYLTNLMYGKSPSKIWKIFQLDKVIPSIYCNEVVSFDHLIRVKRFVYFERHKIQDTQMAELSFARRTKLIKDIKKVKKLKLAQERSRERFEDLSERAKKSFKIYEARDGKFWIIHPKLTDSTLEEQEQEDLPSAYDYKPGTVGYNMIHNPRTGPSRFASSRF